MHIRVRVGPQVITREIQALAENRINRKRNSLSPNLKNDSTLSSPPQTQPPPPPPTVVRQLWLFFLSFPLPPEYWRRDRPSYTHAASPVTKQLPDQFFLQEGLLSGRGSPRPIQTVHRSLWPPPPRAPLNFVLWIWTGRGIAYRRRRWEGFGPGAGRLTVMGRMCVVYA